MLTWVPHPSGRMWEARITGTYLRSLRCTRAQVWLDDGQWWAAVLELDCDSRVSSLEEGQALIQRENDRVVETTTYVDSLGRPHTAQRHRVDLAEQFEPECEAYFHLQAERLEQVWP